MRRTPLRPFGKRHARWEQWQSDSRSKCIIRAANRCEGCKKRGYAWHHCFGRKNIIAEPLASHPAMTTWLCVECHALCHGEDSDPVFIERIRWAAIQRCLDIWTVSLIGYDNPVDAARAVERAVNATLLMEVL